jgi:hypothetical protein
LRRARRALLTLIAAPHATVSTDATLFREEAERARRYAAAMTDKKVIDRR